CESLRPYRHLVQDAGDLSDCTRKADTTILDNNLAIVQVTAHRRIRRLVEWLIRQSVPDPSSERTCRADHAKNIALDAPEVDTGGIEHSRSCLGDRIERALTVLWYAGDDTENVSRRGLPFERFPQFAQQPRVLNGNDGLGGEVLYERDLLVSKRPNFLAVDDDRTDQLIVFEHRHAEVRARTGRFDQKHGGRSATAVCLIGPQVRDVDDPLRGDKATMRARSTGACQRGPAVLLHIPPLR